MNFMMNYMNELKEAINESTNQYHKWQENSLELFRLKFSPNLVKNFRRLLMT